MADICAFSLRYRLFDGVTSGVGAPGLLFVLINVAVLAWIYNKRSGCPSAAGWPV